MKYVLFYESADDVAARAPEFYPAHVARFGDFADTLLMIGTFTEAQRDGAMAVFRTQEGAERFAHGDPFVLNGVVRSWHVQEWNEVLAP